MAAYRLTVWLQLYVLTAGLTPSKSVLHWGARTHLTKCVFGPASKSVKWFKHECDRKTTDKQIALLRNVQDVDARAARTISPKKICNDLMSARLQKRQRYAKTHVQSELSLTKPCRQAGAGSWLPGRRNRVLRRLRWVQCRASPWCRSGASS